MEVVLVDLSYNLYSFVVSEYPMKIQGRALGENFVLLEGRVDAKIRHSKP